MKRGRENKEAVSEETKKERNEAYRRQHKKRYITMLQYARQALKDLEEEKRVTPTQLAFVAIAEAEKELDWKDWKRLCKIGGGQGKSDPTPDDAEWRLQMDRWYRATAEALDRVYATLPKRELVCEPLDETNPFGPFCGVVYVGGEPDDCEEVRKKRRILRRVYSVMNEAKAYIRNPPTLRYDPFIG